MRTNQLVLLVVLMFGVVLQSSAAHSLFQDRNSHPDFLAGAPSKTHYCEATFDPVSGHTAAYFYVNLKSGPGTAGTHYSDGMALKFNGSNGDKIALIYWLYPGPAAPGTLYEGSCNASLGVPLPIEIGGGFLPLYYFDFLNYHTYGSILN